MLDQLTDDLLELTVEVKGRKASAFAAVVTCCSSSSCCCGGGGGRD
jgi:hypothetical protein